MDGGCDDRLMPGLRLLIDPPAPGPWNMAVDDVLLDLAAATGQATLRFYQWQQPTLSLGYFQALDNRRQHAASQDCPVVRRASGGGAILHDRELTYSLAIPQTSARLADVRHLYELCHGTLIAALADYGVAAALYRDCAQNKTDDTSSAAHPFLCFQRRTCFDVVIDGAKIAGSAQRRRRGAVLQHGSVLLGRSPQAPELPGIQEVAAVGVGAADLAQGWTPRLAELLNLPVASENLGAEERSRVEALSLRRFAAVDRLERR